MSLQTVLEHKLASALNASHIEVVNESHQHNVPAGSESHFKVVLVSDRFDGKSLVAQHRLVYDLLAEELKGAIHALALHTYTEPDWAKRQSAAPASPPCRGGGK